MKTATINQIKRELQNVDKEEVLKICLKMAKFKTENKELLTYLLYESHDEAGFQEEIKREIDDEIESLNQSNYYYTKKGIRKIVRRLNRYLKFTENPTTNLEVLLYFCEQMNALKLDYRKNSVLNNIYATQVKKMEKTLLILHEDLQYDYRVQIEQL